MNHDPFDTSRNGQFPEASDNVGLLALWIILWRGKWIFALCNVIFLALAALFIVNTPAKYTAEVIILIDSGPRTPIDINDAQTTSLGQRSWLNTEIAVIASRRFLGRIVDDLSLQNDPEYNPYFAQFDGSGAPTTAAELLRHPDMAGISAQEMRAAVIDVFAETLRTIAIPDSNVMQIFITASTPEKAARIANVSAEIYIADRLQARLASSERAAEQFRARAAELRDQLEKAENELKLFRDSVEVVNESNLAVMRRELTALRADLRAAETDMAAARKADVALKTIAALEPADRAAAFIREPALAAALIALGRRAPSALNVEAAATEVARWSEAALSGGADAALRLRVAIDELGARVETQSSDLVTLRQLERDVEANAAIYDFVLTRLNELFVQTGIQRAGAQVLSDAAEPLKPSSPRVVRISVFAILLGSAIGLGVVFLREAMRREVSSAPQLEALLSGSIVAQIPAMGVVGGRLRQVFAKEPPAAFFEAVRNVRTWLMLSAPADAGAQVVMLTAPLPSEGKSAQTLALARSFSALGRSVLLIEADMRWRFLGSHLRVTRERPGLIAVVSGEVPLEAAALHDEATGVDILAAEEIGPNPADFLAGDGFAALLETARAAYDVVIIDGPPALVVSDAKHIFPLVDVVLLAVRWGATTRQEVAQTLQEMRIAPIRAMGAVLYDVKDRGAAAYDNGIRDRTRLRYFSNGSAV